MSATPRDVLRLPVVGQIVRSPSSRTAARATLLGVAIAVVVHGLFGRQLAPLNLATTLVWVHYRGLLVLALCAAGNLFCYACPLMLARDLLRRLRVPRRAFPRVLRRKWLALALFVSALFSYELFDLWSRPLWTAVLVVVYFALASAVDAIFTRASFCQYLCPLGQFSFLASTLSPLEVKVRDLETCTRCTTRDCIRGRPGARGCELGLYLPRKQGNLDCTMCLDCVTACPHDNVGLVTRLPGQELWQLGPRSGLGAVGRRSDLTALIVAFTFGALLNALGMVSPVYALEAWLAGALHVEHEAPVLGALFVVALVVEPFVLLGAAAWATRRLSGEATALVGIVRRHAFALLPLGTAVWLAHYGFHLLTGGLMLGPLVRLTLRDLGLPVGAPDYGVPGLSPAQVFPLSVGIVLLGAIVALAVNLRLTVPGTARARAAAPFAAVIVALAVSALWLLAQPMEMRGASVGG